MVFHTPEGAASVPMTRITVHRALREGLERVRILAAALESPIGGKTEQELEGEILAEIQAMEELIDDYEAQLPQRVYSQEELSKRSRTVDHIHPE